MKLRVWCDSGANIHSCYNQIIDTKEYFGITDDIWLGWSENEKNDAIRDIAWERLDWGYEEID